MRLTNFIRDAFVRAAMHDVPKIDYEEQAQKMARDAIVAKFNKEFPGMDYAKCGESGWFDGNTIDLPRYIGNIYAKPSTGYNMLKNDEKLWAKLDALGIKMNEQNECMRNLENRLKGVAYACTTRKQLEEALPEFSKYLPEEEAKAAKTLPAVANVLSDFVKAGWPKQNAGKIAAAKAAP